MYQIPWLRFNEEPGLMKSAIHSTVRIRNWALGEIYSMAVTLAYRIMIDFLNMAIIFTAVKVIQKRLHSLNLCQFSIFLEADF